MIKLEKNMDEKLYDIYYMILYDIKDYEKICNAF